MTQQEYLKNQRRRHNSVMRKNSEKAHVEKREIKKANPKQPYNSCYVEAWVRKGLTDLPISRLVVSKTPMKIKSKFQVIC